jgi:hypothetical protein
LWLVEGKLADHLKEDRRHLSRYLSYLFAWAMMLDFSNNPLTLIMVVAMPGLWIAVFSFDGPYFARFSATDAHSTKKNWLIIERLTMHLPIAMYGVFFYFDVEYRAFLALVNPINIIIGSVLIFGLFFGLDPRWVQKKDPPRGKWIIITGLLSLSGFIVYYFILTYLFSIGIRF